MDLRIAALVVQMQRRGRLSKEKGWCALRTLHIAHPTYSAPYIMCTVHIVFSRLILHIATSYKLSHSIIHSFDRYKSGQSLMIPIAPVGGIVLKLAGAGDFLIRDVGVDFLGEVVVFAVHL